MQRLVISLSVLIALSAAVGGVVYQWPASEVDAQDGGQSIVVDLQTRVADLETRVSALESTASPPIVAPSLSDTAPTPAQTSTQPAATSHRLTGDFALTFPSGNICGGLDVANGQAVVPKVVVKDAAGKVIGVSVLGEFELDSLLADMSSVCLYPFEVANLPAADFYVIEVDAGRSVINGSGSFTYSFAELEASGWIVHLGDA